jgi:rare lipoprotein A
VTVGVTRATGTASWYGTKFHGQPTANGEKHYDLYGMSAAHKTLPLPTYVKVTNLDNGRTVTLRVNDRGPFYSDRIIDLSFAAAKKLGFAESGTARVRSKGSTRSNGGRSRGGRYLA